MNRRLPIIRNPKRVTVLMTTQLEGKGTSNDPYREVYAYFNEETLEYIGHYDKIEIDEEKQTIEENNN